MDETKAEIMAFLQKISASQILVIVEGKKDKASLNKIGLANIMTIKGPLYRLVEEVASRHKKVIILTDLDPEGKKLYGRIKQDLASHGVQTDDKFREFLFKKTKLRQIEGMDTYLGNLI